MHEGLLPTRLGITVTRKIGRAVARNRIKRLVREVFRRNRNRLAPGLDMVWIAKRQAVDVSFEQVLEDMNALVRRPGIAGDSQAFGRDAPANPDAANLGVSSGKKASS